jgi:hypothetical protein
MLVGQKCLHLWQLAGIGQSRDHTQLDKGSELQARVHWGEREREREFTKLVCPSSKITTARLQTIGMRRNCWCLAYRSPLSPFYHPASADIFMSSGLNSRRVITASSALLMWIAPPSVIGFNCFTCRQVSVRNIGGLGKSTRVAIIKLEGSFSDRRLLQDSSSAQM